jgi:hypothetical protein
MDASTPPWIAAVSADDRDIMKACLRAAADGPFFPDWEFHTLFGMERSEVREVLSSWPDGSDAQLQFTAVNNAFNNLLGYPHGREDVWEEFIPVDRGQLRDLFWRVRELSGANDQSRAFIAEQLQKLGVLADSELSRKAALVRDLMSSARRLGVDIPQELRERLGVDRDHQDRDG